MNRRFGYTARKFGRGVNPLIKPREGSDIALQRCSHIGAEIDYRSKSISMGSSGKNDASPLFIDCDDLMSLGIYLVDDDPSVRDSLSALFRSVEIPCLTFRNADDFWAGYHDDLAGCVLLDIRMPGMSGLELQQRLIDVGSTLPVIFLTAFADVASIVQALKAGAVDFLEKPCRHQQLLESVKAALKLEQERRSIRLTRAEIECRFRLLSERERQVLDLFVAGSSTKQIAKQLLISEKTVAAHRSRLYEKLHVDSIVEMVHLAAHVDAFHPRTPRMLATA